MSGVGVSVKGMEVYLGLGEGTTYTYSLKDGIPYRSM